MHFNSTEYIVWKVGRNAEKIRKINVRFKTKYPNGIIMFSDSPSSTLFIELINGHLRIIKGKSSLMSATEYKVLVVHYKTLFGNIFSEEV